MVDHHVECIAMADAIGERPLVDGPLPVRAGSLSNDRAYVLDMLEGTDLRDAIDNDDDGATDCDDLECAGTVPCPGVAVNRSVVIDPDGPSPPVGTVFDPGCRIGSWRLCPDEHHTVFGGELRLEGEAPAAGPLPRLSLYEHSEAVILSVTRDGDDLVLSW